MADRLDSMAILVACVDAGSLSAGARQLRLPLATVSRRVAELEDRLGTALLHRSARGLSLTDPGSAYVAACRRVLEDVAEAERAASGEFAAPRGQLALTAPIVFGRLHVLPAATAFLQAYPEVAIRLEQTDRPVSLQDENIDAAIRIGRLPDSSLRARRLGTVRRVLCAAPGYLAARGRPDSPEALADHDCIAFGSLAASGRWNLGAGRDARAVPVRARLSVNTAEAAVGAAAAGLGMARVLSYQIAAPLAAGQLEILLERCEPEPWPVSLLYRPGPVPQKLRAFIDFAAPRLEAALPPVPLRG
ncbi:LysR family transcriptional regulator [Mangrovicoccus sp. HB161399]|uniref:LysR family transcriptional regulator n=1 Tax=Mangrovicoccus sp. HB161399 TaxID=2720392 RepID=UPI001C13165A|nr:LysR family transcriptional regulator [Mangrovicoccus sp. HB161399]